MKFKLFIFLIISSLTSCKGQNSSPLVNKNTSTFQKASTVKELGNNIMLVYQDRKHNYWFGSWVDGLYKYDGKIMTHYNTKNGLPNNRVDEIKEDLNGNIYINTSSGIVKFKDEKFNALKVSNLNSDWKLAQNDLWFKDGWNSGNVYRYDGKLLHKLKLPKIDQGEDYISKNPSHPNPYSIYSIYKDSKGNIWFGTGALGAFRFNGKSFDWITEKDVAEIYNEPTEPSNGVRSIIEDKDGYFWFNAKFRYKIYDRNQSSNNTQGATFYNREKSIGSLDGKTDGNLIEYLSIAKDNNKELWITTYNTGVWHYDGKEITHHTIGKSKEITLYSIYHDNMGNLWLGTPESGTYKFNGQTFERFKL